MASRKRKPQQAEVVVAGPWWKRIPRRKWMVFVITQVIAVALLASWVVQDDQFGLVAGLVMAFVYAPLRLLSGPLFELVQQRRAAGADAKREAAFYGKKK